MKEICEKYNVVSIEKKPEEIVDTKTFDMLFKESDACLYIFEVGKKS